MKIVKKLFRWLSKHELLNWIPDSLYLKLKFYVYMGKRLNLKKPTTFNEKLQWMKINYRKDEFVKMVDKVEAKQYVSSIIGEEYIIPTLGVWNNIKEIDFGVLPLKFVVKTTHDSGSVILVEDKNKLDYELLNSTLCKALKKSYYKIGREWAYKFVEPKVIIEQYMGNNLQDYKFFCFNGNVKLILVCTDRFNGNGLCEDFFNANWEHLDIKRPQHPNYNKIIQKPDKLELMIELAQKLSGEIPFVRIDFYEIDGKVYFGEITFYPADGFVGFEPESWDKVLGDWIENIPV